MEKLRYLNSSKNWWQYDPKYFVLDKINNSEMVLDVGCSYGEFGAKLKKKGCYVDGIEVYKPAIEKAKSKLDKVYDINLNNTKDIIERIDKRYDVITFMDVLEHVCDPTLVLKTFKTKLVKNGLVYISLPNVANIETRLKLLFGNFDYKEYGVLDRTHLRFFTKKTALDFVKNVFKNSCIIHFTPKIERLNILLKYFPGLLALHFIIECKNDE